MALINPGLSCKLFVTGGTARQNLMFSNHLIRARVMATTFPFQVSATAVKGCFFDQKPWDEIGRNFAEYSEVAIFRHCFKTMAENSYL